MSILLVALDVTMVSLALPSISSDLGASVPQLQWITAGYTVTLASLLMLGGSTADRFGRARVFRIGLGLFTAASLGCALAPSAGWLIAFRVLQGIGGSMMNPVAMSIIRVTFDDPAERAKAIGMWAAVVGLGMAIGPALGGPLVELGWRAVFLVNVPVGVIAMVLVTRFVPESRAPHARPIDPVGQVLVIGLLAAVTTAIIEGPNHGWNSPAVLALLVVSVGALATLVPYELRRREPLIDPRFFRSRPFAAASLIAIAAFASFGGFLFLNTLYLQDVRGLSPTRAGLYTLPLAVAVAVISPISGRVVAARGVRLPLVFGGLALGTGSLMLSGLSPSTSTGWLLLSYGVFGLGFGALNPPITNTAVAGMPHAQAGVAAAVASTSRQTGQTLGVAAVGAIIAAGLGSMPVSEGLAAATHPAWWAITAISAGIVVLGLAASTTGAIASAERAATRIAGTGAAA